MSARIRAGSARMAIGVAWTVLLVAVVPAIRQSPADRPLRVLFIGNSYTYYNNLPCVVEAFAKTDGRPMDTATIAAPGASLRRHWERKETRTAVEQPWDALVLQTQSTFGVMHVVGGVERITDTSSLLPEVRPYARSAQPGTQLFLLAHWKRQRAPEEDQRAIDRAMARSAQTLKARVIPAGAAWLAAGRELEAESLYETDGSHPSALGTYLTALTTYAALTGEVPEEPPVLIRCAIWDEAAGKPGGLVQEIRVRAGGLPALRQAALAALAAVAGEDVRGK